MEGPKNQKKERASGAAPSGVKQERP
jgi:hypothetical protein